MPNRKDELPEPPIVQPPIDFDLPKGESTPEGREAFLQIAILSIIKQCSGVLIDSGISRHDQHIAVHKAFKFLSAITEKEQP